MTDPAAPPKRRRLWLVLLALPALALLVFTLYLAVVLRWSYSDGERAGILQKFSRKGWVCKTFEGELAMSVVPGVAPTIWEFSVRDDRVVPQLNSAIGRRVVLHYSEHRGVPTTCFGHTNYFVDSVAAVP